MAEWLGRFRKYRRDTLKFGWSVVLVVLLMAAVSCLFAGLLVFPEYRSKLVNSAGLLFDVAGVVQLSISDLFTEILEKYGDEQAFPLGPPSAITRMIIDNPDAPVRTGVRNTLFFSARTGFYFLLIGFVGQLAGTWL